MSVPADKMIELFNSLSETERKEVYDFAAYLTAKKKKAIRESFKNAPVDEEELSEDFIKELEEVEKESALGHVVSAEEVFKKAGL